MSTTPHQLAQYTLQNQLGRGNVGEVWKAYDRSRHQDVAVKIFHPDLQRNEAHFLTHLTNHGQALVALRHPNIVHVQEIKVSRPVQSQETLAYLVMDYIEGPLFSSYLRATAHKGLLPALTDVVYLFTTLGKAIDYAHRQGIVHGNIKPGNILLHRHHTSHFKHGEPLLTDFGLTQLAGTSANSGHPLYVSPEQAQGFPANNRSDIYALGVILYELCTGSVPFRDENPIAVMTQHIHRLPIPPLSINPNLPPQLSEVILHAMAKDPFARFPRASLLAIALAEACSLPLTRAFGEEVPLAYGHSSQTSPHMPSILGVAQPYSPVVTSRPLTAEPPQESPSLSGVAPTFSYAAPHQTRSQPTASIEPVQPSLPKAVQSSATGKQTIFGSTQTTEPEKLFKFNLPSLPSVPPASMRPAAPSTRPITLRQTAQQPSVTTYTPPKITLSRITTPQISVPVSQAIQPDQAAAAAHSTPSDKKEQPGLSMARPLLSPSLAIRARLFYQKAPAYIIFASLLLIILILGSAIGGSLLINQGPSPSHTMGPERVFLQDDALGQNDQLHVEMQNIVDPPDKQSYFAWLQNSTGESIPLGPLNIHSRQISFIYAGNNAHTNLLGSMQGFFITTLNEGSQPPLSNKLHKVYQASYDTHSLHYLKNILYQTPGLPDHGSVTAKMLDVVRSINDKAASINDSLYHDNGLVTRQAARIIDMLDGSAYAAQSHDRPASVPSELNAQIGLLSSPKQSGYLDVLDQQLQQFKQVSQHNAERLQHIQNVENALTDLRDWLQKLRAYDVQLLKAADLSSPAILSIALQLKQAAADVYTGRTIPPNTAPQPVLGSAGASQAYTEAQYMATLDIQAT